MRAAEWKRASGGVAVVLPEYSPIRFGFLRSDEWIASGFYVDSSAFSASVFYMQAFVMPRFVPAPGVYYDHGFRVGRYERIGSELADAVAAAKPEVEKRATLAGLLATASDWKRNIRHAEVHLCTAVIMERRRMFKQTVRRISSLSPEVPWEVNVRDRCLEFAAVVEADGFAEGQKELLRRRAQVDQFFVTQS